MKVLKLFDESKIIQPFCELRIFDLFGQSLWRYRRFQRSTQQAHQDFLATAIHVECPLAAVSVFAEVLDAFLAHNLTRLKAIKLIKLQMDIRFFHTIKKIGSTFIDWLWNKRFFVHPRISKTRLHMMSFTVKFFQQTLFALKL